MKLLGGENLFSCDMVKIAIGTAYSAIQGIYGAGSVRCGVWILFNQSIHPTLSSAKTIWRMLAYMQSL